MAEEKIGADGIAERLQAPSSYPHPSLIRIQSVADDSADKLGRVSAFQRGLSIF